jgi:hypothetical protein
MRRSSRFSLFMVVLPFMPFMPFMACGGEAPPTPAPTPKVAPAPAPAPVKAAEPEVALHDRGRVFMVGGEVGFVPLACSVKGKDAARFASGEACLALLPTGAAVRGEDGAARKVTGTAKDPCAGATAVTVEGAAEAWRGHATAPPVDDAWAEVVPPTTPDEDDAAAPAELRARVVAQVEKDHPGLKAKKLQVRQRAMIDLDGDGAPEQVVAIAVPGPKDADGDETLMFAGLYVVAPGDAPPRKLAGAAPGKLQYRVLGALDLDEDKKPELWLNTYDADQFTQSVEQVGEAGLTQLGRWVCEA